MNPWSWTALFFFTLAAGYSIYCAVRCFIDMQPARGSTRELRAARSPFEDLLLSGRVEKGRLFRAAAPKGVVVMLHNWGASKNRFYPLADELAQAGYHAFLYDLRGHGENTPSSRFWLLGIAPRLIKDCHFVLNQLRSRTELKNLPFFLAGFSLGSGIALEVFKEDATLAGVLCDSGPFSLKPSVCKLLVERTVPHRSRLTKALINAWFCWIVNLPKTYRVLKDLSTCRGRPLLLIQNGRETFIPIAEIQALRAQWPGPIDYWVVEKAQHLMAFAAAPKEYLKRLTEFFERAL